MIFKRQEIIFRLLTNRFLMNFIYLKIAKNDGVVKSENIRPTLL